MRNTKCATSSARTCTRGADTRNTKCATSSARTCTRTRVRGGRQYEVQTHPSSHALSAVLHKHLILLTDLKTRDSSRTRKFEALEFSYEQKLKAPEFSKST
ncbi:hypothetical protein AMTR_s00004p00168450 [Amborella trichopoda]|uniref:Uncharacterized protein n=1 Tax=Amborella trichopoda TaxID=13333 RepID=W1NEY5_AMBTC|nr:hypothetical protein AMTR_s00004p00168450 [Amborella trichopoda]